MRYLAGFLLLVNLGVFAWILTQPPQTQPQFRPIPVPPGVQPLLQLSERGSVPQVPASAAPSGRTPASQMDVDVPAAGARFNTDDSRPEGSTAPVDVPLVCQTVGPLTAEEDVQTLSATLSGQGYAPHIRTGEVRTPSGYWVYMSPMPAAEARRIVEELDAHDMKDYFIGKQNYISLGIFSVKDKAQTRLEQMQSLGLDAILDQRFRTRKIFWLDIEERAKPLLGTKLWAQIQALHPDIRVQRVSCE